MDAMPGVWQRFPGSRRTTRSSCKNSNTRRGTPELSKEYKQFISQNGVWGNNFDLALCAYILDQEYGLRLIVLDSRTFKFTATLLPQIAPQTNNKWEATDLVGCTPIKGHEIVSADVVVLLNGLHFTACPCKPPSSSTSKRKKEEEEAAEVRANEISKKKKIKKN